jgi:hypothetical protein
MRLITIACLIVLLFSGCGGPGSKGGSATPAARAKGELSPAFNLTGVDGSTISFKPDDNPNGDVTMVLFWSYRWDPNAKTLLARASELHERYAPRGLRIIAVAYDEAPSGLRTFLAENKTPFPVAVGVASTADKFDVKAIPTAVLVGKDGKIVERWEGYFTTEEMGKKLSGYLPGREGNSGS